MVGNEFSEALKSFPTYQAAIEGSDKTTEALRGLMANTSDPKERKAITSAYFLSRALNDLLELPGEIIEGLELGVEGKQTALARNIKNALREIGLPFEGFDKDLRKQGVFPRSEQEVKVIELDTAPKPQQPRQLPKTHS